MNRLLLPAELDADYVAVAEDAGRARLAGPAGGGAAGPARGCSGDGRRPQARPRLCPRLSPGPAPVLRDWKRGGWGEKARPSSCHPRETPALRVVSRRFSVTFLPCAPLPLVCVRVLRRVGRRFPGCGMSSPVTARSLIRVAAANAVAESQSKRQIACTTFRECRILKIKPKQLEITYPSEGAKDDSQAPGLPRDFLRLEWKRTWKPVS
ncbi:uncharacterized protein LOC116798234 [Chiroxiphia lanceolata]|uniref:uncharacterized protein LOC116798234 n=1 Tax=Chiroxiphia lanceolata TaxID=296741 RepID=UPI0013CE4D27|nr:uncharacterized protein LOC116798234 [Chiroxiphia lanceolata]